MKDFNDLKNIWHQQNITVSMNPEELIHKAKKNKKEFNSKIAFQLGTLCLSMLVVAWVAITIPFEQMTTYLGIGLLFTSVAGFSGFRMFQMFQLQKIDLTLQPEWVLPELEKVLSLQKFISTKLMTGYILLLNVAMGLYFIEVMSPMSTQLKIICLSVYIAWMLFAYFYLGKKQKLKEQQRLEEIIKAIKQIQHDIQSDKS